ncbi:SurA N-terminal domain-containing protein [Thermodesulfobacteriota bacterium]
MMKIKPLFILLLLLSMQLFSCSKDKTDHPEILAKINDYNFTLREFQTRLAAELEMERDFKLTKEARDEFLDAIIKKELLIQEAKKLDLDKEDRYIPG